MDISHRWVVLWLGGILVATAVAAVSDAPSAVYVVLAILTRAALVAERGRR